MKGFNEYAQSLIDRLKPETQALMQEYLDLDISPKGHDWRWFHKYPAQCLTGDVPACKSIMQAAYRHFRDTERDDIYVCPDAVKSIMTWFKFCPIPDGPEAGKPLTLDPPLIWMTVSLIGWRWSSDEYEELQGQIVKTRSRGKRRFKEAFNLVARKFSKTTWTAAMGLYCIKKGPFKSRGYTFATTLDQAKEVWGAAASMIDLSPQFRREFTHNAITSNKPTIKLPARTGSLIAKAGNSDKQDGLNPIFAALDECHAITDYNTYGVVTSAFGAQEEYLFLIITTAGTVLDGLCTQLHKTGLRVLDPDNDYDLDTCFYAIFQLDEDDEWSDQDAWLKANPSTIYGRPSIQYLRQEYQKALTSYEQKANFLTKNCNMFVNSASKWLDIDKVRACADDTLRLDDFRERKCYLAFDRSVTHDVTSLNILFPDEDGGCTVFWLNIQTEQAIKDATDYLRNIYLKAESAGHLKVITDSQVFRTEHIVKAVKEMYDYLPKCENVFYDPYKMKEPALILEERGVPMVSVSQGASNLSEPAKKLEGLIADGKLRYNGDTMFDFACTCAVMDLTKFNNVAVYKEDWKTEKIDPLIALIINLSGATLQKVDKNIYEERGMLYL